MASAARQPNRRLKNLIDEAEMTYQAVATAVRAVAAEGGVSLRTNKSAVEHWVSGSVPAADTGRFLTAVLSRRLGRLLRPSDLGLAADDEPDDDASVGLALSGDPLTTLQSIWRYELDRRRFLLKSAYSVAAAVLPLDHLRDAATRATAAARTGHTIGMAEVQAVRDMISAMTDLDERHGGRFGRTALIAYLRDDVAPLCRGRFRTDEVRRQMLSAASRGVHLLGWKHYDAGQHGLAQRYYLQSYALAHESELTGHAGFVLRTMAMQGLRLHRPEHCLDLAETGLTMAKGKVDFPTEALFRVVHAHTLAKAGHPQRALDETRRARALLAADPGDEPPFWALTWGPARASVFSRTARVHETLGDHHAAAEQYARAASARPRGNYARVVVLDLANAAEQQLKRGGVEQACATWMKALDHLDGVHSVRTRKAVLGMRADIARYRARGLRCAVELDDRARDLLASA
ncbi:hypothetical protein AB0A63_31420 [Lentzea sp. NPDC042327]|uniref:hypothetical protein n=1 Tax=Lentzea sp. NPDC042327 TaxID=3154801 RepID=UPI0033E2D63B